MQAEQSRSKKLADQVLDRLLAMIEAREVEPGGLLPSERQLMQRFDVGRPAVREALQWLASMGMVQIRHGGRARLNRLRPEQLLGHLDAAVRHLLATDPSNREHMREARLMFESGMVRLAAAHAAAGDLQALCEALAAQTRAAEDAALFMQCDIAFHVAIARVSRNPVLTAVCEALLEWLFSSSPRLLRVPNAEELTLAEHFSILAAIEAHDPEAAAFAMRAHLTRANPRYAQLTGPDATPL